MGAQMFQSPRLFFIFGTYKSAIFTLLYQKKDHNHQSYSSFFNWKKKSEIESPQRHPIKSEIGEQIMLMPAKCRMLM